MKQIKKLLLIFCLILSLLATGCSSRSDDLEVTVVNVKHGDCILLQTPSNETMMIDTGNGSYQAQTAIQSAMEKSGIDHIDILVLTHPHKDHIGGASWILNTYPVETLYTTTRTNDIDMYRTLQQTIADKGITPQYLEQGKQFTFGQVNVQVLSPYDVNDKEINNTSIVLQMSYGENKLLFMGDAEEDAEKALLETYGSSMQSTFLKVGHHGIDSTTQSFLQTVQPSVCVISKDDAEGYSNKKQKKQQKVCEDILNQGAKLYQTDVDGTITLSFGLDQTYEIVSTGK